MGSIQLWRTAWAAASLLVIGLASVPACAAELNPCAAKTINPCAAKTLNPCAAKTLNPCAAKTLNAAAAKTLNPCAAKTLNPCAAKTLNPCAAKTLNAAAAKTLNPCRAKTLNPCEAKTLNPCDAKRAGSGGVRTAPANPCNPCGGAKVDPARFKQPRGEKLATSRHSELVAEGKNLWNDRSLGNSGVACSTCHYGNYGQMNDTFDEPYPHYVAMPAQQGGVSEVSAAEMVNFCMIVPMQGEPLPWQSRELAALAAYVERIQAGFEPGAGRAAAANPCNPCSPKRNPCNPR